MDKIRLTRMLFLYCFSTLVKAMRFQRKNLLFFVFLIRKEKIKQISFAFDS
jgi:hypothetical protein